MKTALDYILMKGWDNKQFWHAAWCAEDRHESEEISVKMVSNRVVLVSFLCVPDIYKKKKHKKQEGDQEWMCFHKLADQLNLECTEMHS